MTRPYTLSVLPLGVSVLFAALLLAEGQPAPEASASLHLTATIANVSGAPDAVRIEILRWSTDEERERLLSAWDLKSAPSGAGRGAGKGTAKAGKGGAAGKGGTKGSAPVVETLIPEAELARALQEATTVGYLWTSELTGYALRYTGRVSTADGSQRILLVTQRRLGAMNQKWIPASGAPNKYEFSVIELRLNSKGVGEGKASLTGTVAPDVAAKIVASKDYESLPVVFRDVRVVAAQP